MATIVTYDQLTKVIPQYINRKDTYVLDNLPFFFSLAQRRIADDTKMVGLKKVEQGNLIMGNSYIPKPARWLVTAYFQIGHNETQYKTGFKSSKNIYNRQETYCNNYWPDLTQKGLPEFYADVEYDQLLIVPTPDQPYPYVWGYYEIPELIDSVTQQNYITAFKPNLLVYAILIEIYGYLKDSDQAARWTQEYQQAFQSTSAQDNARLNDEQDVRG